MKDFFQPKKQGNYELLFKNIELLNKNFIKMTKYILCSDYGYNFFIEYMRTFIEYIPLKLNQLTNDIICDLDEIIIVQTYTYISIDIIKKFNKISILNTEQLCEETVLNKFIDMFSSLEKITNKKITLYDYSYINKKLLNEKGYDCFVKEFKTFQEDLLILKDLIKHNEKIYDIGFIGCVNERRQKIFDDLSSKNIKVKIISDIYGVDRDKIISQCKILLNIHYQSYFNIFESIRCNRWLDAGMVVISENSVDKPSLDYKNLYLVDYDNIFFFIIDYLKN